MVGRLYTLRRLRCQQVVCSNLWRAKHLDFKASRSYILHRIMKRLILIAFTLAFATAHPFAQTQTVQLTQGTLERSTPIRSMLDTYCVGCHSTAGRAGGIAFAGISLSSIGDDAEIWEKTVRKCAAT